MTSATTSNPATSTESAAKSLPVTIITGFLGSGKTTLLNHILSNQQGVKTAVLVNEFGDIGIDNALIVSAEEDMVELTNGCICCTINNELADAVYRVLEKQDELDYLVVETTGIADPLPVALTFLGTELRDLTRLDSIITLVDAENYSLDLFNSEAAYSQIAYGDIILLNKTDLVDEAEADSVEVKIRDIKPDARILRTVNSAIAIPLILSVGLFQSDRYFESESEHDRDHDHGHDHHDHHHHDHGHEHHDRHASHDHGHDHHDHHHHSHHLENDGFMSVSFESDRQLSIKQFQKFLDHHLPPNVFRGKGILWFDESPLRHIFHLSGKRFTLDDQEWEGEPKNQLVLIGQNLDTEELLAQLNQCLTLSSTNRGKWFGG
ncbi:CobW family GTP-binding protein [Roseofilum casamattae]|uniref:GTP-binding protein n=1 Tax=Roseofilum casamattae BLCC-M143 TaxID=3022442 RepID=A0ABT7BZD3_9CYAN|nr:GTP-binding protein [Roseofilum casamattae]MDJ1184558.1 GTP-binding protein [Roseofilum casamattae BLCC-M143]